jgi:hypothetical protein
MSTIFLASTETSFTLDSVVTFVPPKRTVTSNLFFQADLQIGIQNDYDLQMSET